MKAFALIEVLANHERILTMHLENKETVAIDDLRPAVEVLDEALQPRTARRLAAFVDVNARIVRPLSINERDSIGRC